MVLASAKKFTKLLRRGSDFLIRTTGVERCDVRECKDHGDSAPGTREEIDEVLKDSP
jgi:hypothetical protein